MKEQGIFSARTLGLGIVTAALAACFTQTGAVTSARAALLLGAPQALGLVLLSAVALYAGRWCGLFTGRGLCSKAVCGALLLWFAAELAQTALEAQRICWQQFHSMAVVGLVPLLCWVGWGLEEPALNHTARILWWFVLGGAAACVLGLAGQMQWERLFEDAAPLWGQAAPRPLLLAEYFALPLLGTAQARRRGVWLPALSFGVQGLFALGLELLFGPMQNSSYTGFELLRAWALGAFSRLDALLVLIWLATALYRVCFLSRVLRVCWGKLAAPRPAPGEAAC